MTLSRGKLGRGKALIWLLVAAAVVVLVFRVLSGGGHKAKSHEAPEITASVVTVGYSVLPREVSASGTVRAAEESTIAPRIMSTVEAVYVREGDRVRRGQLLMRLESRDLSAQASQAQAAAAAAAAAAQRAATAVDLQRTETSTGIATAEAGLRAAKERLSLAKEGARTQERAQARLAVAQAEAQFRNARTEYERMKRLYDQGVAPKQRLDGAETAYEVAKAQFESVKEQADLVEEGARKQEIRTAEEQVRQAEEALRMAKAAAAQNAMSLRNAQVAASQASQARAAVDFARTQLGYASITSPIKGVVAARMVDPGDTVSPGVPVISVEDDSLYRIEAAVPAASVGSLSIGHTVRYTLGSDARSGEGVVSVISPSGDPATRKFLVKVDLPRGAQARSGEFGRIHIPVSRARAILIPRQAVREEGGLTSVFVVGKNAKASMRPVKLGRRLEDKVEVVSGLSPGDRIVVRSTGVLADGARVRVGRV